MRATGDSLEIFVRVIARLAWASMIFLTLAAAHDAQAQELEPRRWSHLPAGINFAALAYAYTDGNIFLDPAILVEDAQAEIHSLGLGYIRTFGLFGKSARVDVVAPFSNGYWEGQIDGEFASTRRQGFGDPRVRLAINFFGSPAQTPAEFAGYRTNTVAGAALEVTVPIGEYFEDRLVNLGSNRWVFRPMIGIVHTRGKWDFEATASAWFYGDNDDYQFAGRTLEQDPMYAIQLHLIHTFRPGLWASAECRLWHRCACDRGGRAQPVRPGQHPVGAERRFPDRPPAGCQGGVPDRSRQRNDRRRLRARDSRVLAHVGREIKGQIYFPCRAHGALQRSRSDSLGLLERAMRATAPSSNAK